MQTPEPDGTRLEEILGWRDEDGNPVEPRPEVRKAIAEKAALLKVANTSAELWWKRISAIRFVERRHRDAALYGG